MKAIRLNILMVALFSVFLAQSQQSYPRSMLPGDYADPSIIRDGKDYYMTHSPFFYVPRISKA